MQACIICLTTIVKTYSISYLNLQGKLWTPSAADTVDLIGKKNLGRWQFFGEKKSSSASHFEFFSWDAQQKINFDVALTVSTLWV